MFKLKIFYSPKNINAVKPVTNSVGDWFDLHVIDTAHIAPGDSFKFSLGFAMELPKGYVARIYPRSSLFPKKGLILTNSMGAIDNKYKGDTDIWSVVLLNVSNKVAHVKKGDRLVQFELTLSQHATVWQKIKHLFYGKIEFIQVPQLGNTARGGYGTTKGYN